MNRVNYLLSIVIGFLSFTTVGYAQQGTEKYQVKTDQSTISWEGHKFFGGKHTGNISIQSGEVAVSDGRISGGSFVIDMNSIIVTDLQGETAVKLANHLKTQDFFDAGNFPTASFVIKKIEYAKDKAAVMGELTLRNTKQEITFLADIQSEGDTIRATAKDVRVDRTLHGSQYGSFRFFENLGRKIVNDVFTLSVEIVASK